MASYFITGSVLDLKEGMEVMERKMRKHHQNANVISHHSGISSTYRTNNIRCQVDWKVKKWGAQPTGLNKQKRSFPSKAIIQFRNLLPQVTVKSQDDKCFEIGLDMHMEEKYSLSRGEVEGNLWIIGKPMLIVGYFMFEIMFQNINKDITQ